MPIRRPFAEPIIARSTAKVSVPRTAKLTVDGGARLAPADRAAHRLEVALERQPVAGPHDPLEADVVDAREERDPAPVLLLAEHGDRARLRQRLDHLDARHDRVAGKVAGAVLLGDELVGDHAPARLQLRDVVEEEERIAVREDRLDRGLVERELHALSRSRSPFRPRWA